MATHTARRAALMSIRPQFASAILSGSKTVEFRKRRLADDIDKVVIYTTAPVQAVVGEFDVAGQVTGTPEDIWHKFSEVAGIDADGFFSYFKDAAQAVGIVIDAVTEYDQPRRLDDVDPGARPPQSVKYLAFA